MREAIVRLKEEFVKAEEEREVEKIEMENKMVAEVPENNKGNAGGRSSAGANNDETIRQMNNKVRSLMDRMEHNKKQLDAANRKTKKMEESRSAMKKQNESLRDQVEEQADTIQAQIDAISDLKGDLKEAKRTIDRLREQAIKLRHTSSSKNVSGNSGTSSFNETIQKKNEERIKVLEAQVKAYKSELARMEATATKNTAKTRRVESKVSGVQSAPSRAAGKLKTTTKTCGYFVVSFAGEAGGARSCAEDSRESQGPISKVPTREERIGVKNSEINKKWRIL